MDPLEGLIGPLPLLPFLLVVLMLKWQEVESGRETTDESNGSA